MSIASALAAEYGEQKRMEWVDKLETAYNEKDWDAINILLEDMKCFYFSE